MTPSLSFVFCLFVIYYLNSINGQLVTSSWGKNYTLLPDNLIRNVTIKSVQTANFLTPSEYTTGDVYYLHNNAVPGKTSPGNVISECIAPIDTNLNSEGLLYRFDFTETIEIYQVWIVFYVDYPTPTPSTVPSSFSPTTPDNINQIQCETFDETSQNNIYLKDNGTDTKVNPVQTDGFVPHTGYTAIIWTNQELWQSLVPKQQSDCPISWYAEFTVGNGGDPGGLDWAICEIKIWGDFVTQAPTVDPTAMPVAPSFSPTNAPSNLPSGTPSNAPTGAPSPDPCPNFNIQQPCCAGEGGFEYKYFAYNIYTNASVAEADVANDCFVSFSDVECCGMGNYPIETPYSCCPAVYEIQCRGTYTGINQVCDPIMVVDNVNGTYYGATPVYGNNTLYHANVSTTDCACDYIVDICDYKLEPTCKGTNAPYQDLCATMSDTSSFLGGGDISLLSDGILDYDANMSTCSCVYHADNCIDDNDYNQFYLDGTINDGDSCTVNILQECCESDNNLLSYGGIDINNLNFSEYHSIYDNDMSTDWICNNGKDRCQVDAVPKTAAIDEYFSWSYNEYNTSLTPGFGHNILCECLIEYDNCTTANPTADTDAPSFSPSGAPTVLPTKAPTFYQYDDYDIITVTQPCCDDVSVSIVTVNNNTECDPNTISLCDPDNFDGTSDDISFDTYINNNISCTCLYNVGYWNWMIPAGEDIDLTTDIWSIICNNITFTSNLTNLTCDNFVEEIIRYDTHVTNCDDSNQCLEANAPIADNETFVLQSYGITYEQWDNYTQDNTVITSTDNCYCYWIYDAYFGQIFTTTEAFNFSFSTTSAVVETPSPTDPLAYTTGSTEENSELVDDAIGFIVDNLYYSIAVGAVILLMCCMLCIICMARKKKKKADEDQEQMENATSPQNSQPKQSAQKGTAGGQTRSPKSNKSATQSKQSDNGETERMIPQQNIEMQPAAAPVQQQYDPVQPAAPVQAAQPVQQNAQPVQVVPVQQQQNDPQQQYVQPVASPPQQAAQQQDQLQWFVASQDRQRLGPFSTNTVIDMYKNTEIQNGTLLCNGTTVPQWVAFQAIPSFQTYTQPVQPQPVVPAPQQYIQPQPDQPVQQYDPQQYNQPQAVQADPVQYAQPVQPAPQPVQPQQYDGQLSDQQYDGQQQYVQPQQYIQPQPFQSQPDQPAQQYDPQQYNQPQDVQPVQPDPVPAPPQQQPDSVQYAQPVPQPVHQPVQPQQLDDQQYDDDDYEYYEGDDDQNYQV